ncbi:hypothetical protein JNM87_06925 [Candidatus Saccharibacteria bacterium]|nr:hypothetical protein [Candidatus Saccharibacteria bacterium]
MNLLKRTLVISLLLFGFSIIGSIAVASQTLALQPGQKANCGTGENLQTDQRVCCPAGTGATASSCFYGKYLNPAIKVLSALAGVGVVIGILIGAIQYASSGGDPQKTAQGKGKIVKSIVALIFFMFLYSGIQFMSPGGVKNNTPSGSGATIAARCIQGTFLGIKPWFAYLPDSAFAPGTCNIDDFDLFSVSDGLVPVALAVADDLVRVAGLVAVAYVIVGGVQFVTSQGEPDRTKRARETIINALIGVVMAIVAASVVSFVGQRLSG